MSQIHSPGHIYLIDDDESMRTSIKRMLLDAGYSVNSYENPIDFLENSIPVSPSVILLDMRMPNMTGLQLQAKLNEMKRSSPIIFISAESTPDEIVEGFRGGAIDFLFKPFNLEDLLLTILKAMERDRLAFHEMSDSLSASQRFITMTPRETEVCHLLVQGLMNKEIAKTLGTTDATIKVHKARIMEKMKAESLQSLVRIVDQAQKTL